MKIATCIYQQQNFVGVVTDGVIVLPGFGTPSQAPTSVLELIAAGTDALDRLKESVRDATDEQWIGLDQVELLAPIPRPAKNIMCMGWNYQDHITETSVKSEEDPKLPKYPIVFTKSVTSVNGPYANIPHDRSVSAKLDWEVELGVIIGRGGKGIAAENALSHVFGYTVINDISARDLQGRHKQFFLGKSLDGTCPMGPWIVTADEISDPQALDLSCSVNGTIKQESNTRHQIFDIATVIGTISAGITLEPGDIIATGTPSGVGYVRQPPEYLQPGDIVESTIEAIGSIRNKVVAI